MQNRTKISILGLIGSLMTIVLASVLSPMLVKAADEYYNYIENDETGYWAYIEDDADLFSDSEEMQLVDQMFDITDYGNAIVKTINSNSTTAEAYAESLLHEYSGTGSGTLFLIDMDNRMLYIYSDGALYATLTSSRANTITDNVYKYASDGDYFGCTKEVLYEEITILNGGRIAQPMKYISNFLLAGLLALIINYIVVLCTSSVKKASTANLVDAAKVALNIGTGHSKHVRTTRTYSPPSSSSDSGGGGGGGSSGGGGGHSF